MRIRHREFAIATVAFALIAFLPSVALAAWSCAGAGTASGAAATMPTGTPPTAVGAGSAVDVRWTPVVLSDGASVEGYIVLRVGSNGAAVPASGSCAGVVITTTCTDSAVPSGSWSYSDTPVQDSWSGGESPLSSPVTVP